MSLTVTEKSQPISTAVATASPQPPVLFHIIVSCHIDVKKRSMLFIVTFYVFKRV